MTAWFSRVGLPLSPAEEAAIGELTRIVAPPLPVAVTALSSWPEAAAFVRSVLHDATWWDQEEEEREALWERAAEHRSEADLLQHLETLNRDLEAEVHDAALAAAATAGVVDQAIAVEAAGMALLAAHQSALASMAGAGPEHRFVRKFALFASGRWPLGYHSARFVIF